MEISYSSSFPQVIMGIMLADSCIGTASAAGSTKLCMEEAPYNYFTSITRNGRQLIWKKCNSMHCPSASER